MSVHADAAIVGGGVIGLTSAWFLAKEGLRVVVFDQGKFGAEASWAGAGILPPSSWKHATTPFDRLRAYGCERIADVSCELQEKTGIDNGYRVCGGIEFDQPAGEALAEEWGGPGVERRQMDAASIRALEPAIAGNLGDAVHLPTMAQLRNPRHLRALEAACLATGRVGLRPDVRVLDIREESQGVAVCTEQGAYQAGHAVLAAGAWTGEFLARRGILLPIRPVRGQIAMLNPGRLLFRRILAWGPRYLVPREEGRILAGSTEENVGFDRRTTEDAITNLVRFAVRLVPELAAAPVEHRWAGLRPGIAGDLPAIGPVPGAERILVAAGHFRAGFQLSLGTARAVTDLVFRRASPLPLDAYRLERFFAARDEAAGPSYK